jgi:hypothetical protein
MIFALIRHPVFKASGSSAIIILQEPTQPFLAEDRALTSLGVFCNRHQHDITLALVWALVVIMAPILGEGIA